MKPRMHWKPKQTKRVRAGIQLVLRLVKWKLQRKLVARIPQSLMSAMILPKKLQHKRIRLAGHRMMEWTMHQRKKKISQKMIQTPQLMWVRMMIWILETQRLMKRHRQIQSWRLTTWVQPMVKGLTLQTLMLNWTTCRSKMKQMQVMTMTMRISMMMTVTNKRNRRNRKGDGGGLSITATAAALRGGR